MHEFDLNLSTRPFPAYRPKNLILLLTLVALAAISGWQAYGFTRYTAMTAQLRQQVDEAQVESEALRRQLTGLEATLNRPEAAAKLTEIDFLNGLIARRSFSWTKIFANLEDMMPDGVHLLSLTPAVQPDGSAKLRVDVRGRTLADIVELVKAIEQSPVFENLVVPIEEKKEAAAATPTGTEVEIALNVDYHPERDNQ
jgi:hypothetical protein